MDKPRHDFQQILRRLRPDRLESVVLLFLTAAIAYQLLVDPVVGMADNRDFARLMDPAGLEPRAGLLMAAVGVAEATARRWRRRFQDASPLAELRPC